MNISDFDYSLPKELITQEPIEPRDHARLFVLNKEIKKEEHKHFYNIIDYLNPGDVLVRNTSKVFPARIFGKKKTGGKVEILLLHPITDTFWKCLVGGKVKDGEKVTFNSKSIPHATLFCGDKASQEWELDFGEYSNDLPEFVKKLGSTPIPPYIDSTLSENDLRKRYQTIYAKQSGSVAAPTAGMHFTPELIKKIEEKGVTIVDIILHVGIGTFLPVKTEKLKDHVMHAEYVKIPPHTARVIKNAKIAGNCIVAVGTTTTRALEGAYEAVLSGEGWVGEVNIFITPGYDFKVIDALITNFHLPKSTLLALVSAFVGREEALLCYKEAVKKKYRFFSFGDAMFLR